jgi:mannose-1-phosphate guanylyltransferase
MRALLLAAGLGTRLRPVTYKVPKCLLMIKNRPLLGILLEQLSDSNIGPFLINTHHLSNKIDKFINESDFKNEVELTYESKLLGTAGTLIANLDFFKDEDGLLMHADNYCSANFDAFIEAHNQRPAECLMTMMTFYSSNPSACGIVELNSKGIVTKFHEKVKNPPGNIANGAIYILSRELINVLRTDFNNSKDFSNDVLPKMLGRIFTYETKNFFIDIGTSINYKRANEA